MLDRFIASFPLLPVGQTAASPGVIVAYPRRQWLGRWFAPDSRLVDGGEALVLLMEPGTGEATCARRSGDRRPAF
jgi:hypothetical protein